MSSEHLAFTARLYSIYRHKYDHSNTNAANVIEEACVLYPDYFVAGQKQHMRLLNQFFLPTFSVATDIGKPCNLLVVVLSLIGQAVLSGPFDTAREGTVTFRMMLGSDTCAISTEFPPFGPVSRQTSLISAHVNNAGIASAIEATSLQQLQPLLDAESIQPKQAAAMAEEAYNNITSGVSRYSSLSKHTALEVIAEASEAVLGSDVQTPQDQAIKGADPCVDTAMQAELQQSVQQHQQQQSRGAAGLIVQSAQQVQTCSDAPNAAHTTEQPLDTSVQHFAGAVPVEDAHPPLHLMQGMQDTGVWSL